MLIREVRMNKPWNPYLAGIFLGLVLLLAYIWLGHGIGASGAATIIGAVSLKSILPAHITAKGAYLAHYFTDGQNPLNDWIIFMAIGTFVGGFVSSVLAGRFKAEVVMGVHTTKGRRLLLALTGGVIMGIGARIGRGCTSGQALSGGALLSVGSWIFMMAVFAGAYSLAYFVRKEWL
jgi:uncharacterized protein